MKHEIEIHYGYSQDGFPMAGLYSVDMDRWFSLQVSNRFVPACGPLYYTGKEGGYERYSNKLSRFLATRRCIHLYKRGRRKAARKERKRLKAEGTETVVKTRMV